MTARTGWPGSIGPARDRELGRAGSSEDTYRKRRGGRGGRAAGEANSQILNLNMVGSRSQHKQII